MKIAWRQPVWRVPRRVVGLSHSHVAHRPQWHQPATAKGLAQGGHAAQYLALAQPLNGEILIVSDDLQPQALPGQRPQGRQCPGRNAVGIDGDRDAFFVVRSAVGHTRRQVLEVSLQISAQQAHLHGVFEQQAPGGGGL